MKSDDLRVLPISGISQKNEQDASLPSEALHSTANRLYKTETP